MTFQIPLEAAESYEARFVPALFARWAADLAADLPLRPGQSVLDVACGTGVVARTLADTAGSVIGLDLNEAMLTVARRVRPDLRWRQGDAAHLLFPDGAFDVVTCQAALMFFPDRRRALREMARVARHAVGLHVPGRLESSPAYSALVRIAAEHAGPEARELLSGYFVLGDPRELTELVESAGLRVTKLTTRMAELRLASIEEFVAVEVESTPLIERLDKETYARITEQAVSELAVYRGGIPIEGHTVIAEPVR
ncbi:class I SAM-dependent methyltransferase [Nonomuraea sp. NPDC050663]|uniref:class I SAM-dependent methyltransferase n=1 Tax=Nonomuraea sp. NPDC050663 TaxID=3364370 RepID=UPI0037A622BC